MGKNIPETNDNRALGSGMSSVRLGHLARIERYVRKNLANRAMTVEDIALANGISSRYLHELFKGSDRTIGQWIRTLRLEAALADLRDPRRGKPLGKSPTAGASAVRRSSAAISNRISARAPRD